MKITDEQRAVLASLTCERLSSDADNFYSLDSFCNSRNENLAVALQNDAYSYDESNKIAYYLVKHPDGDILFYFSLKCGSLYDKYLDEQRKSHMTKLIIELINQKNDASTSPDDLQIINNLLEKFRVRKGITKADLGRLKHKDSETIQEIENELNDENTKVGATFAGVELVEFCANDATRDKWKALGLNKKAGIVVFWHFIVPRILEVMKYVGCEYVFLFAADSTVDETLVNYYRTFLRFESSDDRKATTPLYDLNCKFMYQRISDLGKHRKEFYEHFNPDEDAV